MTGLPHPASLLFTFSQYCLLKICLENRISVILVIPRRTNLPAAIRFDPLQPLN